RRWPSVGDTGGLQGKISSDGCLKKEQMVVSAIASTPQFVETYFSQTAMMPVNILSICGLFHLQMPY
ncbi:hypothetical protein MMS29_27545, partial [Escherichia coli]|nr:hypothetical protein [Escherichia coli]